MNEILLTIAIANYKSGRYLGFAIESILQQCVEWPMIRDALSSGAPAVSTLTVPSGDHIEIIVCDADSPDNSVEVIEHYSRALSGVRFSEQDARTDDACFLWCSEKDRGQSHAFNKAFSRSRGKYLTWLNADDVIPNGSLGKVVKALQQHPNCDWFTTNHFRFVEFDKTIIQAFWGPHWYPPFLQRKNSPLVVFGPSTIFSKKAYEQVGKIDEQLHLAMDTDLWIRFQAAGVKQRRINVFFWAFRMHKDSKTAEFDGHKAINTGPGPKLSAEHAVSAEKVGYKPSAALRYVMLFFRLVDGSLLVRFWLVRHLIGHKLDEQSYSVV